MKASKLHPLNLWKRRHDIPIKIANIARRQLRAFGMPLSSSDRIIRGLKNKHLGGVAFVLGNGPSLKISDLDRLKGQITFASNKVYLAFDQTSWRPTYYFVMDRLVAKNNSAIIARLPLLKMISDDFKELFPSESNIVWIRELRRNGVILDRAEGHPVDCNGYFSENALIGIDAGWTVIYSQLQMAYYMGITEVYLLGVDFSFDVPQTKVNTNEAGYQLALQSQGEVNHFHPDYRMPGEIWAIPRLDCQLLTFELAKARFEAAGRKIYNASRQTKLTVFPRADLDEVFQRLSL